jgi:UDP-N-acetylmuramate--alanine ligase
MGEYDAKSDYFIYEADEFDRNFLAFEPFLSIIAGVSWDHQDIYPTRESYQEAFQEFIKQSDWIEIWREDAEYLGLDASDHRAIMDSSDPDIENKLTLMGRYNRLDAWLVVKAAQQLTCQPLEKIIEAINKFPGLSRRMEQIAPNLYSDYAHTVDKIRGAMSTALEITESSPVLGQSSSNSVRVQSSSNSSNLVVVYEGLHNRRQHYILDEYKDVFAGASQLYWVPSYLAREDPSQKILTPAELVTHLSDPSIARPAKLDDKLKKIIQNHLDNGDMVLSMSGGGGNSLDEWLRANFTN